MRVEPSKLAHLVIAYHEKFGRYVPAPVLRLLDAASIIQDALDTGVPLAETGWDRVSPVEFSPRGFSGLVESGVEFVAADMPQANKTMIQMYAVMREWERDAISKRTKEALSAAKARGVKLGTAGPANLRRVIDQRQAEADAYAEKLRGVLPGLKNISQRPIANKMNSLGIKSPRGGQWHLPIVQRIIARQAPSVA
jgi:hypothetical protein